MADKTATLKLPDGKSLDFPVLAGSDRARRRRHPHALRQDRACSPTTRASCPPRAAARRSPTSTATQGILLYRGYPIEQLAQHCDFLEVCYLLLNGELPNRKQKDEFVDIVTHHTMVHEQLARLYQGFRRDAHPMAVMVGVVGALSAFYHDSLDINDPQHREISAFRLIAKMPTIVAMSYKYSIGQPFMYPKNDLSYTANFMRMMFGVPAEEYKVNDVLVRAHGPHLHPARRPRAERVDLDGAPVPAPPAPIPFACIAAGIACLWGPAHGGANEAALQMLRGDRRRRQGRRVHQAR